MKMKLALGVVVSLAAITLNRIPTENDTKMTDSTIPIQDSPQTEISSTQPKIPAENVSANEVAKQEIYIVNEPENVNPDSNPPQGKAYVEGFGYVEIGGPTQVITGYSDGDINKQVGTMD